MQEQWHRPAESSWNLFTNGARDFMKDQCKQFEAVFDSGALKHEWTHAVDMYSYCTGPYYSLP